MGTSAIVTWKKDNELYDILYVSFDGDWLFQELSYYNTKELIEELMTLKSVSSLKETFKKTKEHKHEDVTLDQHSYYENLTWDQIINERADELGAQHIYYYDQEEQEWFEWYEPNEEDDEE